MAKFKVGDIVIDKGFPNVKQRIIQDNSRFNPNEHTYVVKPLRGGAATGVQEKDLALANSRVRSRNAVVQKAMAARNAEDAEGHEHGSDGKFVAKGGGSSSGGSGLDYSGKDYVDPKTRRMRERLAKMREKNEALRKEIESRKAGLIKKKAETERMKADIMKANVEKWKAAQKSKNSVVQKALNAVAKNWNYKNNYQWFAVKEPISGKCIFAGNEYREDAMDVIKEEKEQTGKTYKLVSRRTLERAGIDPNSAASWMNG